MAIREPGDLPVTVVPQPGGVYRNAARPRNPARTSRHERRSFKAGGLPMKYLILPVVALAVAAPAYAADDTVTLFDTDRDNQITVVATGDPLPVDQAGQPVSVIAKDEIDRIQGPDITRVLERAPGVTISRNGGVGGFTAVRVRGADAEQLLVLIDGVRVADAASPGGGFDFGNLLAGSIDKLELLRGSNSVVWGSQAIGGVLAIRTRAIDGVEGSAELGANDSRYATLSGGGSIGALSGGLSASFHDSDGISSAAGAQSLSGKRSLRFREISKHSSNRVARLRTMRGNSRRSWHQRGRRPKSPRKHAMDNCRPAIFYKVRPLSSARSSIE